MNNFDELYRYYYDQFSPMATKASDGINLCGWRKNIYNLFFHLKDGEYHSVDDAPAVIAQSALGWHRHGIFHRITGPAFIDRSEKRIYYLEGFDMSIDDWLDRIPGSFEEKVILKLRWA